MYANQIDNFIDIILDNLYLHGISEDPIFTTLIDEKKINFVEYYEQINVFIQKFVDGIDIEPLTQIINNKENVSRIMDIIKRYVAYYCFLTLAFYYTGTIKDYRNNIIQFSKMQENTTFNIKNFFDTENNYQLITFFKIIKDSCDIITMTEFQLKTLDRIKMKEAIEFLKTLGQDYIDNYLLGLKEDGTVTINSHNLIKTIVFGDIYRNQEQSIVFEILNEVEEEDQRYNYIDIIVYTEENDYDAFKSLADSDSSSEYIYKELYNLIVDSKKNVAIQSIEAKNNLLLKFDFLMPIADDFLRYHRDSERIESVTDRTVIPFVNNSQSKNIQMALLYQQRKKKDNNRAQIITNKIDTIMELYSDTVKSKPEIEKDILKYFQGPISYRKAVMHNYSDEVNVIQKIKNQGKKVIEGNEYYLELLYVVSHAYFNFKDFNKYGCSLQLSTNNNIDVLRYSNIEFIKQTKHAFVDMHTKINDDIINMVGLTIGPFNHQVAQCIRKENLIEIRNFEFAYMRNGSTHRKKYDNGLYAIRKIIKYFFINTIYLDNETMTLHRNFKEMLDINPLLKNSMIYWIYDIEKDVYRETTYENVKSYSISDKIKSMNAQLYDWIMSDLINKLVKLVGTHTNLSLLNINRLIESYCDLFYIPLTHENKNKLIVNKFLKDMKIPKSSIVTYNDQPELQRVRFSADTSVFKIRVDLRNPLRPIKYVELDLYKNSDDQDVTRLIRCQHEIEWSNINKLKKVDFNKYNEYRSEFIAKYAIETMSLNYVCRACGQVLPMKQYMQDGSFNDTTQSFISSYLPHDVALDEIKEYSDLTMMLKFIEGLTTRFSLITGTNMLTGQSQDTLMRRKIFIKSIMDIMIKHNDVNLAKTMTREARLEYFSKKFNINKDLDSLIFFKVEDRILTFEPTAGSTNIDLNRLKHNNILLYFLLVFITELNASQIIMMNTDKIANIYTFLKHGSKFFGDMLIKKSTNDARTDVIVKYPVLCYLLFTLSHFLTKYKLWMTMGQESKSFDPYYLKMIITSFVDLINSVSIDTGNNADDYVYKLISNKIYSNLNGLFQNNDMIDMLKQHHIRYSDNAKDRTKLTVPQTPTKIYPIGNGSIHVYLPYVSLTFRVAPDITFNLPDQIVYPKIDTITDFTNCQSGLYYKWVSKNKTIVSTNCMTNSHAVTAAEATGKVDRMDDVYYNNLVFIAQRRCLTGKVHDIGGESGKFVCKICGKKIDESYNPKAIDDLQANTDKIPDNSIAKTYSRKELDELADNLDKIEENNITKIYERIFKHNSELELEDKMRTDLFEAVRNSYNKDTGDKITGHISKYVDLLINKFASILGSDINFDLGKYPVYMNDNVYIIDHTYDGAKLDEPVIFIEKDKRLLFKEDNPFFKTDVYYYTDNRSQVDVFYDAVTYKMVGYKEKHRDYVSVKRADLSLKISFSIKERLRTIGYKTKYINIDSMFSKNSEYITDANKNYHRILNTLIREHVNKVKTVIDKISSIIYQVKNNATEAIVEEDTNITATKGYKGISQIISKYNKNISKINIGPDDLSFSDWGVIRDLFRYVPVNWDETSLVIPLNMYVNYDIINFYDISSNVMFYYLIKQLTEILDSNPNDIIKVDITNLLIDVIVYVFDQYNEDDFINTVDIKRFEYILNGSAMMIDGLQKGQGIDIPKTDTDDIDPETGKPMTKENKNELRDLDEEGQAMDVDYDYYAEEDEDQTFANEE